MPKSFLAALFVLSSSSLLAATSTSDVEWPKAAKRGEFTVKVFHGEPGYVELGPDAIRLDRAEAFYPAKDPNLASYAIIYRGWNLIGEYCYSVGFWWELNGEQLKGKNETVRLNDIAKYPDLLARYAAIRPVSVNFVLAPWFRMRSGEPQGLYLRVTDNDLVYFGSLMSENYIVPTSPLRWSDAIGRFKDFKGSTDQELKAVVDEITGVYDRGNRDLVELDVRWPEDEIDAIAKLAREYDAGAKQPPSAAPWSTVAAGPSAPPERTKARAAAWQEREKIVRQRLPVPVPFQKDRLHGYQRPDGQVVLPAQFASAYPFNADGVAKVVLNEDGRWPANFVDATGAFVFEKPQPWIEYLHDHLYEFGRKERPGKDNRVGVFDQRNNKVLIEPNYYWIWVEKPGPNLPERPGSVILRLRRIASLGQPRGKVVDVTIESTLVYVDLATREVENIRVESSSFEASARSFF